MTNAANITADTTVYVVEASQEGNHAPFDVLFGSHQQVFADRADAEAMAEMLNTSDGWGVEGDKLPADLGISYRVDEVDAGDLDATAYNLGDLADVFSREWIEIADAGANAPVTLEFDTVFAHRDDVASVADLEAEHLVSLINPADYLDEPAGMVAVADAGETSTTVTAYVGFSGVCSVEVGFEAADD